MFSDKQLEDLTKELSSDRIKNRAKGNINLSYLEGFDVIDTANAIFGHGNWGYNISSLEQVSQEPNQNDNIVICYKAIVAITIKNEQHSQALSREDVGFGTGASKSLADAHESSAKEAVTDALKRALRSFGNQFGNSLYDKSKTPSNNEQKANPSTTSTKPKPFNNQTNDYSKLFNLGLTLVENGNNLVVVGDDIFAKKDIIKSCGFCWDIKTKLWFKPIEQKAA